MTTVAGVELVGQAELAVILGVVRQRVVQLAARPDFPAPVAVLAMGKVWDLDDIRKWAQGSSTRPARQLNPLPPKSDPERRGETP